MRAPCLTYVGREGIDNIVFVAILAERVNKESRAKARQIGLTIAVGVRILLLFSIVWIMGLTAPLFSFVGHEFSGRDLILIGGGMFLLFKSTSEIHDKLEGEDEERDGTVKRATFAFVLVQIALLDIVFSLDSVITAVGVAEELAVMVIAVVVAGAFMVVAANSVSRFVNAHPTLKMLALSFPATHRHGAGSRRHGTGGTEGVHLLRDGLLRLRGDAQPASQGEAGAGAPARPYPTRLRGSYVAARARGA